MQSIRESIHPGIFGIAAAILIVFLGMLWWRNSGKTDTSPEGPDVPLPTLSSDPSPNIKPSMPATPAEPPPISSPKLASEQDLKSELMDIPSLPANQRQGRHNSTEIKASIQDDTSSNQQPLTATPTPTPAQTTSAPKPVATDTRPATPPWLNEMRDDLSYCWDAFCRENVRAQYCTSQWKNLPECKGISF